VVQEALHNAVKHASARNVSVAVVQEPDRLSLTIADDGKGLEGRAGKGMGMLGMEERVTHLGGAFAVESEPGHGTRVRVSLPLVQTRAERQAVEETR